MDNNPINIYSEIKKLKTVMLHRPGKELENLMPEYLERLLFDDIPFLDVAQQEHDYFATLLSKCGVEVVYLTDLVCESIINKDIKKQLIIEFINEAGITNKTNIDILKNLFFSLSNKDMVYKMIEGIRKSELKQYTKCNLTDYLINDYPFIIDPLPNLYFTRDPFACIGHGVSIHKMHTKTRSRETIFAKYIFKYNPKFKNTKLWYDRSEFSSIEGGDILILNENVICIGISQRTEPNAIEKLAKNILSNETSFKQILAIDIPKNRSFMHLDTVFTMVDYNKFTIHPNIKNTMSLHVLEYVDNHLKITQETGNLEDILKKHLHLDNVHLIKCGGNSIIDAAREQWNDGSNTLSIAPGEVVVYSRNKVTNKILQENGIKIHVIPSSELSRGRGGPRCMSMPINRL